MSRSLARADLIAGLVFTALGIGALVLSLDMPRFEDRNINPYTVPGLVPGILGLIIAGLGLTLAARSLRAAAGGPAGNASTSGPATFQGVALTLLLTLGYAAGLVGRLPFWLATFLFVLAFVGVFEARREGGGWNVRRLALAALYAALLSAVVTYVFQEVFLVRLP